MTLELDGVAKTVAGQPHIHPTNLKLERGSMNVLLGPTLAGKTTLMRLMAGLDAPTSGRVIWDGQDVTGVGVRSRNVAMVYQQFINYPTLTVYDNIASPLRVKGEDAATIDRAVQAAAELLKLGPYLQRTPLALSGGQQQRTAIARAIVKRAPLVLLDEPLANLDYKLREELRAELPRIFAESGAIFVYATTEPSEALLLGGNTATLSEGHVTQFGRTIDVFRHPVDLVTAKTFADPPLNTVATRKIGDRFEVGGGIYFPAEGGLAGLADADYTIGFQPHHLSFAKASDEDVALSARVSVTEIAGSESFVHFGFSDVRWVMLTPGVHRLEPGDPVSVFVDPRRIMVFDASGRSMTSSGQPS